MRLFFFLDGLLLLLSVFIGPVVAMFLSMKFISDPSLTDNRHKVIYIFLGIFLTYVFLMIYSLPTKIASYRNHPHANKINWVNYILGLTGLGWLAALVWSLSGKKAAS